MKYILYFFTFCFIGLNCFSQATYSLLEATTLGSTGSDQIMSIKVDNQENIYVMARTSSTSNNNDLNIDHFGSSDVWLLKLNQQKDIIWQKSYGGVGFESGEGMNILPNGNIILFINSQSDPSGNRTAPKKGPLQDVWVVEVDKSNGDIVQQRSIGGDDFDFFMDSEIRSNGEIVVLTTTNDTGTNSFDITEPPHSLDSITADPWIATLDAQLNIIQQKRITQGPTRETGGSGFSSLLLTDDFVYIASSSNGNVGGFKSDSSFNFTSNPFLLEDCWLIKLDWNFDRVWDKTYGGIQSDRVIGLEIMDNNQLIVAINSESGIGGNKISSRIGTNSHSWLIKVDEDGNKIEDKSYGNSDGVFISTKIIKTGINEFLFGGFTYPFNDFDFSNTTFYGDGDSYLMSVDNNLNIIDITAFGTPGDDGISSIHYSNGKIITGGSSNFSGTNIYHPQNGLGSYDLWILELSTTLDIDDEKLENVMVYPNPVKNLLYINDADNVVSGYSVLNTLGEQLISAETVFGQINQIDVKNMATGIYFLKLRLKNGNLVSRKFIVE